MGVKTISTVFVLLFVFSFCKLYYHKAPSGIKETSRRFCFSTEDNDLNKDRLSCNGYYRVYRKDSLHMIGTLVHMIFFDDGMFATRFGWGNENDSELLPVKDYLEKVNKGENSIVKNFYQNAYWGSYKINRDTIVAQYINRPALGGMTGHWYLTESKFQILDKGELKIIETNSILYENNPVLRKQVLSELNGKKAQFFKIPQMPSSDSSWLKNEKWFWCYEEEYFEWQRSRSGQ